MIPANRLKAYGFAVFFIVFLFTFPLHHLKNKAFGIVSSATGGAMKVYASDFGITISGLTFEDVNVLAYKNNVQMESLSVLPSLDAFFNGSLGAAISADGVYGGHLELDVGRGFSTYYVGVEAEDIDLAKIKDNFSTPGSALQLPPLQGSIEIDGGLKLNKLRMPLKGNGDLDIEIPSLKIPQKFSIAGFSLPAITSVSPGLRGTVVLENATLRLQNMRIGKKGQSLWGKVDGTIQTSGNMNRAKLDLAIELTLGADLKNSTSIKNLITNPMAKPFVKNNQTIALRLRGTPARPMPQPL